MRIISAAVCQPLAMRPPYSVRFAASGSVWNSCGSQRRPNSSTSSSVTRIEPASCTEPGS